MVDWRWRDGILRALADGTWRPTGELARAARIGTAAAGPGLAAMVESGLLTRRGRGHRAYYGLAPRGSRAAAALDASNAVAIPLPTRDAALRHARTCYGHLAGELGVALYQSWLRRGWLCADHGTLCLPRTAVVPLVDAGWPRPVAERLSTLPGRPCIDWTERRPHVGGALGKAIAQELFAAGWLRRTTGSRAVALTGRGCVALGVVVSACG